MVTHAHDPLGKQISHYEVELTKINKMCKEWCENKM